MIHKNCILEITKKKIIIEEYWENSCSLLFQYFVHALERDCSCPSFTVYLYDFDLIRKQ